MTGVVLSGTGGVWRVLTASGESVEATLRGRLKKADMEKRVDGGRKRDTVAADTPAARATSDMLVNSHLPAWYEISENRTVAPSRARRET